jgi:ribosomal protein S27AE
MPQPKQCPKCAGSMAEGFVLDRAHGAVGVSSWVEGMPERSVWTGVRLRGRAQSAIATWRCGRCGFLESYASGEPDGSLAAQKKAAGLIVALAVAAALLLSLVAAYLAQRGH